MKISGYRRSEGKIGIRNHVVVLSSVHCASEVARKIASLTGAVPITHFLGCLEHPKESEQTRQVLLGVLSNPNIAAALVVGLGCEQIEAEKLAEEVSGKPVESLRIQDCGVVETISEGAKKVQQLRQNAALHQREKFELDKLIMGVKCGGSDATSGLAANPALGVAADLLVEQGGAVILGETEGLFGAEHILARRTHSKDVGRRLIDLMREYEDIANSRGVSLTDANPTPGNVAGGITTLKEKALGSMLKGGTSKIRGLLKRAEYPPRKGLWIMETSRGVDVFHVSDLIAGGTHLVCFTSGRGSPLGSPIAPVIKITANARTAKQMSDSIDIDVSTVIQGKETIQDAGERIFREIVEVANGRPTKNETLQHWEFGVSPYSSPV